MEKKQSSQWYYNGQVVTEDIVPVNAIGFIYRIDNMNTTKFYIGKKQLQSTTRKKIGIREKTATKTRKTFKTTTKSSGWMNYWGSCKELIADVKELGEGKFTREIIEWVYTKKMLSYLEVQYQINHNVLDQYTYNGNILNRWFRRDIDNERQKKAL